MSNRIALQTMKSRYDMVIVGHITHDLLNDRGKITEFIGGAAYFSSFAAARSGARMLVLTKMAKEDFGLLGGLRDEGIEVVALPSRRTTRIENIFETEDVDRRSVRLLSQADPFYLEEIPDVQSTIYDLAGLFKGEIDPCLLSTLSKRAQVALDLQGMLRADEGGSFLWQDWPEKKEYLPCVTFLKADSLESEVITGNANRHEAAKILHGWGAKEVMVTHSSDVIVYDGIKVHSAPFNPANLSGRTGRGDTCFGSYMAWRLNHGIEESLRYAAALTSIKMERPGPFQATTDEVFHRMKGPD